MHGRHRWVVLADLLDYQGGSRDDRRAARAEMVREGEAAGMYHLDLTPVAGQARSVTFPVVLDTNVLFGAHLRDTVLPFVA